MSRLLGMLCMRQVLADRKAFEARHAAVQEECRRAVAR